MKNGFQTVTVLPNETAAGVLCCLKCHAAYSLSPFRGNAGQSSPAFLVARDAGAISDGALSQVRPGGLCLEGYLGGRLGKPARIGFQRASTARRLRRYFSLWRIAVRGLGRGFSRLGIRGCAMALAWRVGDLLALPLNLLEMLGCSVDRLGRLLNGHGGIVGGRRGLLRGLQGFRGCRLRSRRRLLGSGGRRSGLVGLLLAARRTAS